MFKDYYKYLSTSLKVYLFVLVIVFILKLVGLDYFGLNLDNEIIIKLADVVSYNVPINNLVFFVPLLLNEYIIISFSNNDNSKRIKIYTLLILPIYYVFGANKIKWFSNLSFLMEIIYYFIVSFMYKRKFNKDFIKRYFKIVFFMIIVQIISIITRTNYPIEYIQNPISNIILNLDYIIMLLIIYKINFMKGDESICYSQEVQRSSLLKQINLKILLKQLQRNLHSFKKQDKVSKLTFIIYSILCLFWNLFTLVVVLLVGKLNNTLVECIFIITSFWLSKRQFGKAFHLKSMIQCFIVSNITYYILNRITAPLGISIFVPIMLGVGLSYVTSKLVKKTYKPLYKGMPKELFEETISKVVDKESDRVYAKAREMGTIGGINTYTEEYYMDVNYYLRNNDFPPGATEPYKDYVKEITLGTEKTINEYQLKENLTTYKGTSSKYYENYNVGDTFEMKEFNSTSINKKVAESVFLDKENPYTLEIRVSKGTNAMYLGKNSANSNEYELLINRNTSYKVIEKNEKGMILEVVKNVK